MSAPISLAAASLLGLVEIAVTSLPAQSIYSITPLLSEEDTHARGRRARKSRLLPRRDEIISKEMADPNRSTNGYRSQEDLVANARTAGARWRNCGVRDHRKFPGTTKKTLRDRASNMSSPRERDKSEVGNQDHPQWPVRSVPKARGPIGGLHLAPAFSPTPKKQNRDQKLVSGSLSYYCM